MSERDTPNGATVPDPDPTPMPWEDDEQSIRAGMKALATHIIFRLDAMTQGLKLEFQSIRSDLDALKERTNDTGRHLIVTDMAVGRAEGKAEAALRSRHDSDPARALAITIVTAAVRRVPAWLWPILSAGLVAVAHYLGWLGR